MVDSTVTNSSSETISFDEVIKTLTFLVAFVVLIKGLFEYTKAQRWKKAEFLANEIKDFFNDKEVQEGLIMLDWNEKHIRVAEGELENGKTVVMFNDHLLERSLLVDYDTFSPEETWVRLTIDNLLFRLGMFNSHLQNKLITTKDLQPYLQYWITLIADKNSDRKSEKVRKTLWEFIKHYHHTPVIELCHRFGYDIRTTSQVSS